MELVDENSETAPEENHNSDVISPQSQTRAETTTGTAKFTIYIPPGTRH